MILYSIDYLLNDIYCDVINGSFLYEHIAYNSENEQWLQFVGKKIPYPWHWYNGIDSAL